MRIPSGADRDFTASAFVVRHGEILLVYHRGLERWIQPGGHVEGRETPDEAAKREVREETGYEVVLRHPEGDRPEAWRSTEALPRPLSVAVHEVRSDHWHVDFTYLGALDPGADRVSPADEHRVRWVSPDDMDGLRIDDHTRRIGRRAVERWRSLGEPPTGDEA